MAMNPKDEIREGESYSLEFKLVPNEDRAKYLKTVVAFANGKGGRILFGVANDGTVRGIAHDQVFAEMDGIVNSIVNGCSPRVPVDVGIENIDGKSVIAVEIMGGSKCPYFVKSEGSKDGVYVRVGATTQRADDETRVELALASEGRSFDCEPCPKATIDERRVKALCARMYRTARENCDTEEERRTVKRITPDQLEAWGILSRTNGKWVASNAYALLVGDAAFQIRLKCGLFKGDDKAVFLDRREFSGSVTELIDEGIKYILAKINVGCYFKGAYRHDRYELPPDEMRELVINAFAHRSYLDHEAPVFIAVYDNRVEITSPGGLPRGQTAERAVTGFSKIRNEALAKALNYMHFMEEWGSGLKRVNEVLGEYGLRKVAIEDVGFAVRMNVYRKQATGDEAVKAEIASKKQRREGASKGEKSGDVTVKRTGKRENTVPDKCSVTVNDTVNVIVNDTVNDAVNSECDRLFLLIRAQPGKRTEYYARQLGRTRRSVMRYLSVLSGKVEFRGAPKTGGYYCKE
jgi:predicted HTH transcriptional regulator